MLQRILDVCMAVLIAAVTGGVIVYGVVFGGWK